MPDANGRIKGISLAGVSNPWLDSLERRRRHAHIADAPEVRRELLAEQAKIEAFRTARRWQRLAAENVRVAALLPPRGIPVDERKPLAVI